MVASLGRAINTTSPEESALLARYCKENKLTEKPFFLIPTQWPSPVNVCLFRYHYLRGLVNTVSNRRLDALEDFQSLYKTDSDIFPSQMVKSVVDSLPEAERLQVSPCWMRTLCCTLLLSGICINAALKLHFMEKYSTLLPGIMWQRNHNDHTGEQCNNNWQKSLHRQTDGQNSSGLSVGSRGTRSANVHATTMGTKKVPWSASSCRKNTCSRRSLLNTCRSLAL